MKYFRHAESIMTNKVDIQLNAITCFLSHKIIQRLISVQRFGADELEEVCNLVKITKHKVAPLLVGRKVR